MKHGAYKFEIKNLTETGEFEGLLSVYGVVDLGGDVVESGAFTKSIAERGNVVPLLWQHDAKQPIGLLELEDTPTALKVKGKLVLEVERAREAYALMKAGVVKGLSIGYDTVKSVMQDGARRLKELRLWEGSAVTFPMCEPAQIGAVKSDEQKTDFVETLQNIQTWSLRYQMIHALDSSLDSIVYNRELSTQERTAKVDESINQFREQYLDFLPRWFSLMEGKSIEDLIEQKAGRRLSAATRAQVEEAITKLSALLEDPAGEEATEEDGGAATKNSTEPGYHSWLASLTNEIKENVPHV